MKFCSKCRTENNDDAVYCNKCGEQFSLIPRQTSEYPYKPIYPASVESCEIRKKTSKMAITGIIISVAIMSLLIISIFVPWYNVDVKLDGNYQVSGSSFSLNTDYKIFFSLSEGGYEIEATKVVDGISEDYKDSDKRGYTSGTDKDEGLNNLMNITYFLTILSILITIITLIFFIAFLFKKIGRIPVIILFIILFVCTFITLFYFGISSPSVMQGGLTTVGNTADLDIFYKYDGFFGSATDTQTWSSIFTSSEIPGNANVNMTWGPSYGWYLMLISAILSIVGLCVTIFKKE